MGLSNTSIEIERLQAATTLGRRFICRGDLRARQIQTDGISVSGKIRPVTTFWSPGGQDNP
jgi:hypothetical protein